MIQVEFRPEIEAQLGEEAQACGLALDRYIERIVQFRPPQESLEKPGRAAICAAVKRILDMRNGVSIGRDNFKDLIDEGRRI